MKSAVLYTLIAGLSFTGPGAFAQGTCQTGGGQYPGVGTAYPYPAYPSSADVQAFLAQGSTPVASPNAAPQARITVVDAAAASGASVGSKSSTPSARVTVVSEVSAVESKPAAADNGKTASDDNGSLDPALKGLVGNWTAVARYGDNELTTVELQLDDHGWAKLTVPGSDGTRSTINRRVEFKSDEIKLTGADADVVLGKLVSVNSRQMVLEKADGQVTFVRL